MRIPLTIILLAALSLFAMPSFSVPKYYNDGAKMYSWETNESQTGRFVVRLVGDGGSSVTVNYQFYGFYVEYFYGSVHRLIPIQTNIKVAGVIRNVSEGDNKERIHEFLMSSQIYTDVPQHSEENAHQHRNHRGPFEINWHVGRRPESLFTAFSVHQGVIAMNDQDYPANYTGTITTVKELSDGTCDIDKTEGSGLSLGFRIEGHDFLDRTSKDRETKLNLNQTLMELRLPSELPEAIATEDGYKFSYQLGHRFEGDGGSAESGCIVGDGDRFVDVNMDLDVNFLHENEIILAPMIYETEAKWLPTPGDIRLYSLHLKKTFGEIEKIQFGLVEVSKHPGVATNAGYYKHCLIPPRQTDEERWETDGVISDGSEQSCPDLGGELSATSAMNKSKYTVPNKFPKPNEFPKKMTFDRSYYKFNKSPIDDMPDVFFTDDDQKQIWESRPSLEYTLVDPKNYEAEKGYHYSDRVEIVQHPFQAGDTTIRGWTPAHHAFVRIMDYGAFAGLFARVKIDGEWKRALAWGATAGRVRYDYLLIPNDQNRDGIQDQWARDHSVIDPLEDLDSHSGSGGQYLGDGLTAFEEYRGLIYDNTFSRSQLTHYRTSPAQKQIFVHPFGSDRDLTRLLLQEPGSVRSIYEDSGLKLVVLDEDEFENEIVNYNETAHRLGSQYAIVPMTLPQFLTVTYQTDSTFEESMQYRAGRASSVGPPRQDDNTVVFVSGGYRTLSHEIGHKVNIHHPGSGDAGPPETYSGPFYWVAVKHGQHSGNVQSVMRYRAANYFCRESESVWSMTCKEQAALGVVHGGWIPVNWGHEPKPLQYILSLDGKGTGVNSNNAWAGNAERDGDLPQLNVKSY